MKRDLKKDVAEYWKKYGTTAGCFHYSDIKQIVEMSGGLHKGQPVDLWGIINNALTVGFMVGLRRGKFEVKNRINSK